MVFDHWSTQRNIRDLRRSDKTAGVSFEDSNCHERIKIVDVHCCFLVRLHFTVGCDVRCEGFLDTRKVSSSAEFRSFLLSMCIENPEFTTNYLSSGFVEDGAGKHRTAEGE